MSTKPPSRNPVIRFVPLTFEHLAAWYRANKDKIVPFSSLVQGDRRKNMNLPCIKMVTPQFDDMDMSTLTPDTVKRLRVGEWDWDLFIPNGALKIESNPMYGEYSYVYRNEDVDRTYLENHTDGPYTDGDDGVSESYHVLGYMMFGGSDEYVDEDECGLQVSFVPRNLLANNVSSDTFAWVPQDWADEILKTLE